MARVRSDLTLVGDAREISTIERWQAQLETHRDKIDTDPQANPIRLLAFEIMQEIVDGGLDHAALEDLVQQLTMVAFHERAQRLRRYLGEVDPAANIQRVAELVRAAATGPDGATLPFDRFRAAVERTRFGIVITAHPTFSLAQNLQRDLVSLALERDANGQPLDGAAREAVAAHAASAHHRPERTLDLAEEHRQSLVAIGNIRMALADVYRATFDVATELYPEDWRRLVPSLVNVATWVGYDTDGRSDIGWTVTLGKRIRTQVDQLRYYRRRVAAIRALAKADATLAASLELIDARLALSEKSLGDELAVFDAFDARDKESVARVAATSRAIVGDDGRLADATQLLGLVERALELCQDGPQRRELWVLRAEIANAGLTAARSHVRINAVQLYNAIRKTIGMEHPADDPTHRASYVSTLVELIDKVEPVTVHFGSVLNEKATAKRVFMLIRQMLRYLDASEPMRFLIAECETPLTLLTALYFAKLFGVEDRVDISPLFETAAALERGVEILRGAVEVESYSAYVRQRGRVCIQTGFSDAGRYMGQLAASFAIERIRLAICDMLAEKGLGDLEVIIFDTHGESIGRGAHPSSLADRFRYYGTPQSIARYEDAGIRLRQETSFQGGDGYTFFLRPESSLAVVTRILEHCLSGSPSGAGEASETGVAGVENGPDPFYDVGHRTEEFFAAIRQFNYRVIDDPCYATFLGAYGVNLLYQTGSRPLKRQHERGIGGVDLEHPSQLRAIPHNSILQQLGILANTIGGVGQAIDKDPGWFHALYRDSPRFRRLMTMLEHAFMFTDLDVVKAYIDQFDPGIWLRRAQLEKSPQREEELRHVADLLEQMRLHDRLERIFRVFLRDYNDLARALRDHRRMTRDAGDEPIAIDPAIRNNIHTLHALRMGIMQALMLKAVHVPDFSDRHETTHDEVVAKLLRMDVEPALKLLGEIFPLTERSEELDFGEHATYRSEEAQSYGQEHERIFKPIAAYHDLVRRISSGIIHHIGALG